MRRADFNSDAEYYRAHREVFLLAQELRVTPAEAERRMKEEEARQRHLVTSARLEAKVNAPLRPASHRPDWGAPWMMQE